MSFSLKNQKTIKKYILKKIRTDDDQYLGKISENFQISETSVKQYICDYIANGIIEECPEKMRI